MINFLKIIFFKSFAKIDAVLKFPNLTTGEIGIQVGFDMMSPLTTDIFLMHQRVSSKGMVIGIDPDPINITLAEKIINKKKLNIILIQKATYSSKGETKLVLGKSASWNQLKNIPLDTSVEFSDKKLTVQMDKLDNIINDEKINIHDISHINLTINGAEYETLKGMHNILKESKNISLTVVSGRYDESGIIDGKRDYKMILDLLHSHGFQTKFRRINQIFWWGVCVKLFINKKWIFNKKNYGIIMASKGTKKIRWYQAFS